MFKFKSDEIKSIKIGLLSEEKILKLSTGEVQNANTFNYKTMRPEKGGLFCERIFGPVKDYECSCGKYKGIRYDGVICNKCGVEVTLAFVRRNRMGHISLVCPIIHPWYILKSPCILGILLKYTYKEINNIVYYNYYVVLNNKESSFKIGSLLTLSMYEEIINKNGKNFIYAETGAEAIFQLLNRINFNDLFNEIKFLLSSSEVSLINKKKLTQQMIILKKLSNGINSNEDLNKIIINKLLVLPPNFRPIIQIGGKIISSEINNSYRKIIIRNIRLKKLIELKAPGVILNNEKRMLQEAIDILINNKQQFINTYKVFSIFRKEIDKRASLVTNIHGKYGRFRRDMLGKRVDFSGRAVIVIGPSLKIYQCGVPIKMAMELFKPFIMHELIKRKFCLTVIAAKQMVNLNNLVCVNILKEIIKYRPVLLNRAPTLHKLNILAFQPILINGYSIKLNALVCASYNADFDGDEMTIHIPISFEACLEAIMFMFPNENILKPSNAKAISVPTKDIVLGCYCLTKIDSNIIFNNISFNSFLDAKIAYLSDKIKLNTLINIKNNIHNIQTTVGRILLYDMIPQCISFSDINKVLDKKEIDKLVDRFFNIYGKFMTTDLINILKELGFKYATNGAISINLYDTLIKDKDQIIKDAYISIDKINTLFNNGIISKEERNTMVVDIWLDVENTMEKKIVANETDFYEIIKSGSRGNKKQLSQVFSFGGLIINSLGKIYEAPIISSYVEGLMVHEFFIQCSGGRKGLTDKCIKTSSGGYLTRRLVDVAQNVVISIEDCFNIGNGRESILIENINYDLDFKIGDSKKRTLKSKLFGRYTAENIIGKDGNIIFYPNTLILDDEILKIEEEKPSKIYIRSCLTCLAEFGICQKCYGISLSTLKEIQIGEAVGVLCGHSIGEPSTQLFLNSVHAATLSQDVSIGFQHIEELLEAKKPFIKAIVCWKNGIILDIQEFKNKISIFIEANEDTPYIIDILKDKGLNIVPNLRIGDKVNIGQPLTNGGVSLEELMLNVSIKEAREYLLDELQKIYLAKNIYVADKYFEIIIRQMTNKMKIISPFLTYIIDDIINLDKKLIEDKIAIPIILGITKRSLLSDSFLSAVSFQDTKRTLIDAIIQCKVDNLIGLKESLIIGKTVPCGTGFKQNIQKAKNLVDILSNI